MGKSNSIGSADSRSVPMLWRGIASSTLFRTDQVVRSIAQKYPRADKPHRFAKTLQSKRSPKDAMVVGRCII